MNEKDNETFGASMEKTLIEEYLDDQGYSMEKLKHLPDRVVRQLMKEATRYAALKMQEIEARAHLVDKFHEEVPHHS